MKTYSIAFLALLLTGLSAPLLAQQQRICMQQFAFSTGTAAASNSFSSTTDAQVIVNKIMNAVGLKPNFEIRAASIDNAAAVIYNRKRYLLYNPVFIQQLNNAAGNEWASISVLAHEVGHHLDGHTLDGTGSQPAKELEADEFSGFVLQKLGATLQQAQAAMKLIANVKSSATHPGQYDRLTAIAKGWNSAGNPQMIDVAAIRQTPPAAQAPAPAIAIQKTASAPVTAPRQTVLPGAYIASDVFFKNGEAGALYYVTVKMNLVRVKDNQLAVIGRLASTDDEDFPLVIYDQSNTRLLIDAAGNIRSAAGSKVGMVRAHR